MTIESSLISALEELTPDTKFVLSWRNGVESKSVYCLVTLLATDIIGGQEESLFQDDGDQHFTQTEVANIRLQFMGDSSSTGAEDAHYLKLLMRTFNGRNCFYRHGLSVIQVDGVKRVGVVRDTKTYIASIIDMTLMYRLSEDFQQYSIDTVDVAIIAGDETYELTMEVGG